MPARKSVPTPAQPDAKKPTKPRKPAAKRTPASKAGKGDKAGKAGSVSTSKGKKPPATTQPNTPALTPLQAWTQDAEAALSEFCDHITAGGHLAEFCRERGFSYTSMQRWINADPGRTVLYARAREDRADKLADEMVAISDEATVAATHDGENVTLALDSAAIQRNRLRVDARKWIAAKLKPRTYGDKLDVTQNVTMNNVPDADLTSRALELLRLAGALPSAEEANGRG